MQSSKEVEMEYDPEFVAGYQTALKDVHRHLLDTYQSAFTWDDIAEVLQELGL